MAACQEVRGWITENVLMPVEQFMEQAREACHEARRWVEREVRRPIETWRTQEERRCQRRKCKWWCACCNKWFCWIVTVVVKVVEFVIEVVGEWLVETVCEIVVEVVRIVVMVVVQVVKWVVVFFVCLFTDPLEALKSFRDLWVIVLDTADAVVDLVTEFLDDVNGLLEIVEDFIEDLGRSFGPLGTFIAAIAKWILNAAEGVIGVVRDLIETVQDIVLGILSLNPCRLAEALANLGGTVVRAVTVVLNAVTGGGYIGGGKDIIGRQFVEDVVERAIEEAFPDEETRDSVRERLRMGSTRFGLPITPELRRMCISSREKGVDLRALHNEGVLDLYQLAGHMSGCPNGAFNHPRGEVVYAGTRVRVSYADLSDFLDDGPSAVPEFEAYAITKAWYEDYYKLARRKAKMIGITLEDAPIEKYRVTNRDEVPVNDADQSYIFQRMGRAPGTDLCRPAAVAVFGYVNNSFNGMTTWFRPPDDDDRPAGVTFKDRQPGYMFRWVLIHELGHYWGLDHAGHNGAHHIMFTNAPSQGLNPVTGDTIAELVFFTGEPGFSVMDAVDVWDWLAANARNCLRGD